MCKFLNRKTKIVTLIILCLMIPCSNICYAGWPVNYVPSFTGAVTDATTGRPIEKAVVQVSWRKDTYFPLALGDGTRGIAGAVIITDKDGKYKIPSKISLHIYSNFKNALYKVTHPLYVKKEGGLYYWGYNKEKDKRTWVYKGTKQHDGTILYDIKLVGLEEAIIKAKEEYERTKDWHKAFNFKSYIGTYSGSFFKDNWDKEFVEKVLKEWKEIANRHGGFNSSELREFNRVKKEVEEAYK